MLRMYYRLRYRLDGSEGFLLWFSNEEDGVFTEVSGRVPFFDTEAALCNFAARHGLHMEAEADVALHDLDSVQAWTVNPRAETLDCVETLAAWNLFIDVASSVPVAGAAFSTVDKESLSIYETVFWGNNLPAFTPQGKRFEPTWTEEEVSRIASLLSTGLELFRRVRQDAV